MADKKFEHDDQFPDNVNPTEENRRKFTDQVNADRKAQEERKAPKAGVRIGGEVVEEQQVASDTDEESEKTAKRGRKAASE